MMAEPLCVIEHFVRLILGQWHCGLQPNLDLRTDSSGAISVNFNVTTSPRAFIIEEANIPQQSNHRKSGRGSRLRRQNQRSQGNKEHSNSNCSSEQSHGSPTPPSSASSLIPLVTSETSDQLGCDDEYARNQDSVCEPSQVDSPCLQASSLDVNAATQTQGLKCHNGSLMEDRDVPASSSECSDTVLSEPHSLSSPNQADGWSQKLYKELDAIFQIREDRYNSRMEDHMKSISENFYSKIKAKLEHSSNASHDELE